MTLPHKLEFLVLSLYHSTYKIGLSIFFLPPNSSPYIFDTLCNTSENIDISQFSNFVLLGDFNVDMYNHHHPLYKHVNKIMVIFACLKLCLDTHMWVHKVKPLSST